MTQAAGGQWADLGPRLISGGLAAAIGISAMWYGGVVFHILISVVCGIMIWEVVRMIDPGARASRLGIGAGLAVWAAMELPDGFALPLLILPAMLGVAFVEKKRLLPVCATSRRGRVRP